MNMWGLQEFGNLLSEVFVIVVIAILIVAPIVWARKRAVRTGRSAGLWTLLAIMFGFFAVILLYILSWGELKEGSA